MNSNSTESQKKQILEQMRMGFDITPLEALRRFGCFRLGARIHELRQAGHDIQTEIVTNAEGKRYASYSLNQSEESK